MNIFMPRSFASILIVVLAGFATRLQSAENLLLTEFLAANNTTLPDEDGQYSDWIEIYNGHSNTVNLADWFLTDTTNNYVKWRFPATNLAANGYLVVFASGKDRRLPGGRLHTSFALSSGGEYLALVKSNAADGLRIVSKYFPTFPPQEADVSYGLAVIQGTNTLTVLGQGSAAKAFVPASDIGASWRTTNYDDSAWINGTLGVGYDLTGTNVQGYIGTDVREAMFGSNTTAYVRVPFQLDDPGVFEELQLRMRYNDGFVAYLNGVEVARRNAPATALWNSATPTLFEDFESGAGNFTSTQYGAAPAPAIQSANTGSTGKFLRLIYDNVGNMANAIAFNQISSGSFERIIMEFDFRVASAGSPADGFSVMLIPTSTYGASGPGVPPGGQVYEEPNFPNVFAGGFDVYPHTQPINDVSLHWNGTERINSTLPIAQLDLAQGVFHRARYEIFFTTGGANVSLTLTRNINGAPGAPTNVFNNYFIPEFNPYDARLQFGGRTGGLFINVDLDNVRAQFIPRASQFEEFTISPFLNVLRPGANVLAIQGLARATNDTEFLLLPELIARDLSFASDFQVYFGHPTPGGPNDVGSATGVAPPQFSTRGGVFTNSFPLQFTSASPLAVFRYTTDGSPPTAGSLLYTGPITVSNSMVLRVRVFLEGYLPSAVVTESYTMLGNELFNFNSPLPLIIINSLGRAIPRDSRVTASFTAIETYRGRSALVCTPEVSGLIGTEIRGQSSADLFPKKSYNVEFQDADGRDTPVSVLGYPAGSDFALYAPYTDKTFMNDFLAYELSGKMGHYAVRRRFVEVFVDSTGGKLNYPADYAGIYVFLEKIRIDKDRVNIADLDVKDITEPDMSGGYIWKKDKDSPDDVNFFTSSGQLLKYHDPRGDHLVPAQRAWLANHLNEFEAALYGANWRDPLLGYTHYIDVESFVDYHWIVEFAKQIDGYRLSNYMHKDRGGKIKMDPIWDWNLSFGNANYLEGGRTNGFYYPLLGSGDHLWLRRLVGDGGATAGDPDFVQKTIDRWEELRNDLLHPTNLLARVDEITSLLNEPQGRDFAKWPRLGTYIWPNPNGSADAPASSINYTTPTTYAAQIVQFKIWLLGRFGWIDALYLRPPTLSRSGGSMALPLGMYAPTGSVYYTLDGSDPRAPGGSLAPGAALYTSFVTLPANARVMARVRHTNAWSAPVRGVFGDAAPALAITELMYHPRPPANTNDTAEDIEFIEFKNTGANPLNLQGIRLADGVEFVFPAGALAQSGARATNNFDGGGTTFTPATLGGAPGPAVTAGGPAGNFMHLLDASGSSRNRIAFNQTATGNYDKVIVDFDFRASSSGGITSNGAPTTASFDSAGTAYTLTSHAGTGVPTVTSADAGSSGNFLRITPGLLSEIDSVVFDRTATGAFNTVVAAFDFRFTPVQGQADGLGFAFLRAATFGATGPATGFGGLSEEANVANSLGVGFDNYANAGTPAEPNANHVSLHYNGVQVSPIAATPSFNMSGGRFHRAQILLRFTGGNALVTVRITPDINGTPGPTETLFDSFVVAGVTPYEGRVALGARTGGLAATHDIDNVDVQYLNINPPGGFSMAFLPTGPFGVSGAGSTLAHYTDEPNAAGLFALDFDLHPASFINDVAVHWNGAPVLGSSLAAGLLDLDGGVFHHAHAEIVRVLDGSAVTLTLTPDVFGTPGAPITVLSNAAVPGYSPASNRVEFAGRSGGLSLAVDVDNVSVQYLANTVNSLAPGETILLVRNRAAFEALYGPGLRIGGEYLGSLNNAGERLLLLGALGDTILDFSYSDNWYPITDGQGFSLVLLDPNPPASSWGSSGSWRPSSQAGGSPGASDPAPPAFAPVLINEVRSRSATPLSDAIELHNPTMNIADVSGWYLSDSFNNPKKYRLPPNSLIPPGGFLVLYETNFNALPGAPGNFALGGGGDDAYLFSADAPGELTGYFHGFDFGASEADVTFARYVNSEGREHFVAQSLPTLNGTNAGPRVGPVVLSEIMYHPPTLAGGEDNDAEEFIELLNITDNPVPLHDPAHPENTWRLRGAVDFDFPSGASLPAHGFALVVSFDPTRDQQRLPGFLARYGLTGSEVIFGPYQGRLNNSGESIALRKPDAPDPNDGSVPHILVEQVNYRDSGNWPVAADGFGRSLHRLNVAQYGDDPINWTNGLPTPASSYVPATPPSILTPPASLLVLAYQSATFSVMPGGPGPFTYQWRFNGDTLPGATNGTLLLPAVRLSQSGSYQVLVLNTGGSALSAAAVLTVLQGPSILVPPQARIVTNGNTLNLTVTAIGNGPLTYQWRREGVSLPGHTAATLTITNMQDTNAGNYSVDVSDAVGTIGSQAAPVVVYVRPVLTQHPQSVTVLQGDPVTFTASATGSPLPLSFRWRRNPGGVTLTNIVVYGANSTYTIPSAHPTNSGQIFTVVVTNLAGATVLSSNATLIVLADNDGDRIPDDWERLYGLGTNNPADAFLDPDMDGLNNYQEYLAGTNPTNGLSYLKLDSIALGGPSPNTAVLLFSAVSNHTYTVSFADRVLGSLWASLADFEARTTNRVVTVTNQLPAGVTNRYYRLQTPRLP